MTDTLFFSFCLFKALQPKVCFKWLVRAVGEKKLTKKPQKCKTTANLHRASHEPINVILTKLYAIQVEGAHQTILSGHKWKELDS